MKPWKRIEPTEVTKVGFRMMTTKHFELPSGVVVDRTVMHEDGWAAACAIALTPDNQVILVRQFRPGPEKIFDEIPGGIVDPGETPEQCVVREFTEETGYVPGRVEYLGICYHDAYVNGDRHYFMLYDCVPSETGAMHESDEELEVLTVSIDQLIATAKTGMMSDVGGIMLAYDTLQSINQGVK